MPGSSMLDIIGTVALLDTLTCHVVLMMHEVGWKERTRVAQSTLTPSHVIVHGPSCSSSAEVFGMIGPAAEHASTSCDRKEHPTEPRPSPRVCSRAGSESGFPQQTISTSASYPAASKTPQWRGIRDCGQVLPGLTATSHLNTAFVPSPFGFIPVVDILIRGKYMSGLAHGFSAGSKITDDAHPLGAVRDKLAGLQACQLPSSFHVAQVAVTKVISQRGSPPWSRMTFILSRVPDCGRKQKLSFVAILTFPFAGAFVPSLLS